jgi:hypothetical protein
MKAIYTVFGLTVASELELPELAPGAGRPEIAIRLQKASAAPPGARVAAFHGGNLDVRLEYAQTATLAIRDGREIVVEPRPDADPTAVRALVLGPAFAVLLHQRGVLALHASSVRLPAGVAAFLGGSGWGKSTIAATLERRGHVLVADDVTAVRLRPEQVDVLPAFPQLKLWPEAARALSIDPDALPLVVPNEAKRARRVAAGPSADPLPLAAVFVLAFGEATAIAPLTPREALLELVRHSYCAPRLAALGAERHFVQCGETAKRVPVRRLTRPRSLEALAEVAELVEREVEHAS